MKKVLITIGVILICLTVFSMFGGYATGSLQRMFANVGTPRGNGVIIGYFSWAALGIILVCIGLKKKKE